MSTDVPDLPPSLRPRAVAKSGTPSFQTTTSWNDAHIQRRCPIARIPMDLPTPSVSVIVATFNRSRALERLLDSVRDTHYCDLEVVVVDCAARADALKVLEDAHTGVRFLHPGREILPSEARNLGASSCRGALLLFVDDDNVVEQETVCALVRAFVEDDRLGLAAPVVYYLDAPTTVWSAGSYRRALSSRTVFPNRGQPLRVSPGQKWPFPCEDFADAYMVRRDVFARIRGFDAVHFPIHFEEADLCRRVRDSGYAIRLVPGSSVWHDIPLPGAMSQLGRSLHIHSPLRAFYAARSRIVFQMMHERDAFPAFLLVFLTPLSLYYLVGIGFQGTRKPAIARAYLHGTMEGLSEAIRIRRSTS